MGSGRAGGHRLRAVGARRAGKDAGGARRAAGPRDFDTDVENAPSAPTPVRKGPPTASSATPRTAPKHGQENEPMRYMMLMHAPYGTGDYQIFHWAPEDFQAHMDFLNAYN